MGPAAVRRPITVTVVLLTSIVVLVLSPLLVAAAAKAPPRGSLRPTMLSALLGVLASTGLRIGEAVRL